MLADYFATDYLSFNDLISALEQHNSFVKYTHDVVVAVIKLRSDSSYVLKGANDLSREVAMLKRLNCEYIVKACDSGKFLGKHWLLMEFCELGDLFQLITARSRLDEEVVRALMWQLLIALGACHSANIAHLDIKLENCFLTRQGKIRLGDFGHAQTNFKNLTINAGTQSYQAPEIVRRDSYDGFAADVFSSGVCLFVLLFGRRPWLRASEADPYFQIFLKSRDEFWIRCANADVSEHAMEVLDAMLEPVPELRLSLAELMKLAWFRENQLSSEDLASLVVSDS